MTTTRKPFTAKPFAPGAEITWTEEATDGTRREVTGQVWSLAPLCHNSSTVWAVPLEGGPATAVVKLRKGGRVYTRAGRSFREGEIFTELSDLAQTGSLTAGAVRAASWVRHVNTRAAAA